MITLLSCMCYYHSCVQYLKLIVLYWNFLLLCVWTDICTLYLFYVSEINIYYYYYYPRAPSCPRIPYGVLRRCLNIITLLSERDKRSLRDSRVLVRCASAMSEHHYIIVRKGHTITDRGTAAYWYGVPRRCLNIITLLSERDKRSLRDSRVLVRCASAMSEHHYIIVRKGHTITEGQPRIGTVCLGDV